VSGLQHGRSWWQRLTRRFAGWLFARLDSELVALKVQTWHRGKDRFVRRVKRVRHTATRCAE